MPIYEILTSDDLDDYDEDFKDVASRYVSGKIYFVLTDNIEDGVAFSIKYDDQTIEYNSEDRWSNTYTFNPSGLKLIVHDGNMIEVITNGFKILDFIKDDQDDFIIQERLIAFLTKIIKIQAAKRKGRNLTSVARIGISRGLPENVEGEIGEMLSGKRGHLVSQMNQLRQNTGESLAPRVRARGGKRTTRKRR